MSTELTEVTKAVEEFDRVAAGLKALQEQYGNVVYDVTTTKGMGDAKAARAAIREPRYEVEKIRKAAKAPILSLGKKLDSEAARITRELEALEEPIDRQIKAEEDRKEQEKQAKIEAEMKRVADLQERVAELRGNQMLSAQNDPELIAGHISDLEKIAVDDSFQEFRPQAEDAKVAGLSRLRQLHAAAVAHKAEQERIRLEREELVRLRAEQEKRDAAERAQIAEEQRKQAEELRKQQEALAAERREQERKLAEERARLAEEERNAREAREAEERRLAAQRAELQRQQEEARRAREAEERARTEQARLAAMKPPTAKEIVGTLATHYRVPEEKATEWLVLRFGKREAA